MTPRRFRDRHEAGRCLVKPLLDYAGRRDVVVLALPRGGVPVAFEIARALHAPLDVLTIRKVGVPGCSEFAMGAVGSGGTQILDRCLIDRLGVSRREVLDAVERERRELNRRLSLYRDHRPFPRIDKNIVLLVDDGLATGASMVVAVGALRNLRPARIVLAVPVAPAATCRVLRGHADEVVCLQTPDPFVAVGAWYDDFAQVSDDEVRALLGDAALELAL
jgi:putative phosphoribosyl transferase